MPRTDINLDETLRHLGAAYYDSLHGKATQSDVRRALETVEGHLRARQRQVPAGATAPAGVRRGEQKARAARHVPRVRDVMTTSVATVDRLTPYGEIVHLLTGRRISGVPVLQMGRHVAGVVSEADLLAAEDWDARRARMQAQTRHSMAWRRKRHVDLDAENLMTAPAVTINPDATIPRAARVMDTHHVRRLPVVDQDGKLMGIVSRRDLLSVFLRPDEEVAADVRELLDDLLPADSDAVTATVRNGEVILTGNLEASEDSKLIPVAIRLIWDVEGVIDVDNRLGEPTGGESGGPGLLAVEPQDATTPGQAASPEPGDASAQLAPGAQG
jgi:CBS domain-containing protein